MTAPQHDATPPSKQENSQTIIRRQKLQRCWFVGMGLLGGFGFVTSQMSFALAETDFLVYANDAGSLTEDSAAGDLATGYAAPGDTTYVADSYVDDSYAADSYADDSYADSYVDSYAADESYTTSAADLAPAPLAQPTFEVQAYTQPVPAPEVFVEAPATPAETVASFAAEVPAAPAAELPIQATAPAEMTQLEAAPQPTPQPTATRAATVTLDELRGSSLSDAPGSVPPVAATPAEPSIQIEITAAANDAGTGITPTTTTAAQPTFTRDSKPTAPKAIASGHPLAGLMEAGALAAPLSAYASSQATLVSNVVDMGAVNRADATVAMGDDLSLEAPAAVDVAPEPFPAAVPDILPAPAAPAPAAPPIVEIAPPVEPIVEAAPPVAPVEIVPAALPEGAPLPEEYDSIFVDPTDYSIGATEAPDVVISEQSTGCEFTVGQSQGVPNGACGLPTAPAPVAEATVESPSNITAGGGAASVAISAPTWQEAPAAITPVASAPSVNVGPVSFSASGIQLSTSAAGRDYLNRSVRPLVNLQATEQFIFPLAIPSPITSLFGFRTHPITGDHRFHAGTDIGAEQGTPVLAAQDGTVAAASAAGGYGLMVVLRHETEELNLESRYAHLAEIFVEAGTDVKKGDIIGLVGSTGNSTGPHLHFEMRQMTADGWVLVNADGLVQNSLSNLVNALNNPMETLSFNLSDFNLSNLRARGSLKAPTTSIPTFPVSEEGIPFRPAQPNAS